MGILGRNQFLLYVSQFFLFLQVNKYSGKTSQKKSLQENSEKRRRSKNNFV